MKITDRGIVRISMGSFAPELTGKVESMFNNETKNSLIPAIQNEFNR